MCEYHGLSSPVVPLVVSPVLERRILVKLRARCVVLDSVPAFLVEPTVHYLDIALTLVVAIILELVLDGLLASLSHAQVVSAIELEVIPFVVLPQILTSIVCARLVVIFLEAELRELSHGSIRTYESKSFFVLTNVHVGAGILISSHISKRDHSDVVSDLSTLSTTSFLSWAIASHIEEE